MRHHAGEKGEVLSNNEITLRYGCNPHQTPARVFSKGGTLPLRVVNGSPGYINLLDACNSWQLVRELKAAFGLPAAASFKHVSPAGAAVAVPLTRELKRVYFVEDIELSPLAAAYARARGADRMSSFGDWVALSDPCDLSTAQLLKKEVSDGVIAPGFELGALEILRQKKKGAFCVVEVEPSYIPPEIETRELFGITFEQKRNSAPIGADTLKNVVTENKEITPDAQRDLILAQIALKYTQSNSVCFALGGQIIGVGAGQQSRIHCTRLAAAKADKWFLRQHPLIVGMEFREGIARPERDNAIDKFLEESLTPAESFAWQDSFRTAPDRLSPEQKREWISLFYGVSLGSDAFFPFRDNIDRAQQSGVRYIVQPGGSVRDDLVIEACNEYGMVMAMSGLRLFHH
ncbi:MAG: phosphoribosylaminoimidazolecarboxamide formyltransferase [Chitinispirillaceae bacterium]|nr:phosphoribosylaminoimidazolecarboxamide formyltransferase [Chitinispirillaceae bacterium]